MRLTQAFFEPIFCLGAVMISVDVARAAERVALDHKITDGKLRSKKRA